MFDMFLKYASSERYRPKVQVLLYTPDGKVLASKSQAAGSGLRAGTNYKLPGGGIEQGESIQDATKKELLEEAGWTTSGEPHLISSKKIKWDESFRQQALKKGRDYHGEISHFMGAPAGKRDTRLFGSEGDALEGADFIPINDLIKDLRHTSQDPNNEYRQFDKAKLRAAMSLRDSHFTKKASQATKNTNKKINTGEFLHRMAIAKELAEQVHDMSKSVKVQMLQNRAKEVLDKTDPYVSMVRKASKK